ncbi:DUF4876 domain-containing protein [Sphingobacterium sp. LRF_L2]|uniref:DUF4876 domain-containing protein n=1 Tax=Sphingobacterium sp. LRF_L2 TaxID=3369421 RepID=UPI003F622A7F
MKTIYQFVALILISSIWSCKKDNNTTITVDYTVEVSYPSSYKTQIAANTVVKLTNSFTGESKSVTTDDEGVANFTGLLPGTYQVSATKDLGTSEALELTGLEGEVYLSATVNNLSIQEAGSIQLALKGSSPGGWVIKQVYYTGASGSPTYSNDQFVELYNNSADTLYADGLCVGDIVGNPYISSSSKPSGFAGDTDFVYFQNIFMVPGDGTTYPVIPGASFLIARSAINHKSDATLGNPNSPVDLGQGIADMEVYWETAGRDTDNPDVPNMLVKHFGIATVIDWFPTVFGPSYAIFRHAGVDNLPLVAEPNSTSTRTYPQVPVDSLIDALDCVSNASVSNFKRLPSNVDAGFQFCTNSYTGEAIIRKIKTTINGRNVLQDSNNSSNDFQMISTPTPKGW